jgi:hypothetical protein
VTPRQPAWAIREYGVNSLLRSDEETGNMRFGVQVYTRISLFPMGYLQ